MLRLLYSENSTVQTGDDGVHVGDLANAVRSRTDLRFGLYHSLYEWFNPLYLADVKSNFSRRRFVQVSPC